MVLYIPGGAGFLPSTGWQVFCIDKHFRWWLPHARMDFHEASTGFNRSVWMWDNVLLLAQIKDFRLLGFDNCLHFINFIPLNLSLQHDQRLVISYWIPTFPSRPSNCQPWQPCRQGCEIHGGWNCLDSAFSALARWCSCGSYDVVKDTYIIYIYLVGGFNPFEKYARQIGFHFPKGSGWT